MIESLTHGYLSKSAQRELSNEYQHNRLWMVYKNLYVIVLWTKVASALIWLTNQLSTRHRHIQYSNLNPTPVDRTSNSAWLYKHPWLTYSKHINDLCSLQIKTTFSYEVIHASMFRELLGNRTCG